MGSFVIHGMRSNAIHINYAHLHPSRTYVFCACVFALKIQHLIHKNSEMSEWISFKHPHYSTKLWITQAMRYKKNSLFIIALYFKHISTMCALLLDGIGTAIHWIINAALLLPYRILWIVKIHENPMHLRVSQ